MDRLLNKVHEKGLSNTGFLRILPGLLRRLALRTPSQCLAFEALGASFRVRMK
jgi:hypothetical protein